MSAYLREKKVLAVAVVMVAMVAAIVLFTSGGAEEEVSAADTDWTSCGSGSLQYKQTGTVVYFRGSGAMNHYGDDSALPPVKGSGGPWGKNITEVIWMSGCKITRIGHSAFVDCNNLTSMHWSNVAKVEGMGTVPGSVTSVGKYGFYHCGFTKMVFESGGKVSLDKYALSGMSNVEKLTFNKASSFQTIYPVVDWCGKLTTLEFNGNTSFGWMTFNGSSKIDTLIIGKNVSSISGLRTDQNGDLQIKKFYVESGNKTYSLDDGVLLKKSGSDLYVEVAPIDKEYYYMSDDVTKIAHAAFAHSSIKELHISNKLTTIEYGAFRWSSNLKTVLLPDSCTYVGNGAFIGCTALKTIHFGTGLSTMWAETFEYANISKFDNDGDTVKIDYDGSWVDHQLSEKEIGYLKNMTFSRDGKTMEDTSSRYAVVGFFTNDANNALHSLSVVKKNNNISEPAEPAWEYHAFDGWYRDNNSWARQWVFSYNIVQDDVKLYGMWTADSEVQDSKYPARSWNGVQRAMTLNAVNTIDLQRDIYAYGKGALVLNENSPEKVTLNLNGHTLDRQRTTSDEAGHVIKVGDSRKLTITDSMGTGKITGGYASSGGAVFITTGELKLVSGTISGNRATDGGAICINSANAWVTIEGGVIEDNTATYGGAIRTFGGPAYIQGGTIRNNVASNDGGAIYIGSGTVEITGGTITNNSALTRCGGAIYINSSGSTLNLEGGTITGNIAAADGGAILYGAGTVNVKGSPVVKDNIASNGMDVMLRSGMFLTVTGEMGNGAMIYLTAVDPNQILAKPSPTAINIARFAYSDATLVLDSNGNLKVSTTTPPGYVWVEDYTQLKDAMKGNAAIIGLSKDIKGGFDDRIKVSRVVTLDLYGHTLDRQKGSVHADGHVIQVMSNGNLTIKDSIGTGKITGGYAKNGGGINISEGGICTINGGTITGNRASIDGGGICVRGTLYSHGGSIVGNTASDTGGGIYVSSTGTIQLSDITIANNTCDNNGGGLRVHVKNDSSWIKNSYIINNKTDNLGGGIYYYEDGRTFLVQDTVITGNSSSDSGGGGVYNDGGTLNLVRCSITDNTANKDGGGIYNKGTTNITDSSVSKNSCKKSGGAIRAYGGTIDIKNVTFTGNYAKEGGGAIYQNNGATINIDGCTMQGNTAGEEGGAMMVNDSSGNVLRVKGIVVMYGNKGTGGNDLYLASGKKITIAGTLGNGTKIGVTLANTTGAFTSGYGTYHSGDDPTMFFVANDGYTAYNNGSEAAVAKISSSSVFTVKVQRTDGKTSSMTVRVRLMKNSQVAMEKDIVITGSTVEKSFEIASVGAAVFSATASIINAEVDLSRLVCTISESGTTFTVTCDDIVVNTEKKITAIGTVVYTPGCKEKIDAARNAYNALSGALQAQVNNYAVLTAAEDRYPALGVEQLITAIGTVVYTPECKDKIDSARNAYNALTDTQKPLVTNIGTLDAAETAYAALAADHAAADVVIALIDAIGPFEEGQAYVNRVNAANSAYAGLTDTQKPLVTNYSLLLEALENLAGGTTKPTEEQLAPVTVTDGWVYGAYSEHVPTVNVEGVTVPDLKTHLESTSKIYTYMDTNGAIVVPSSDLSAGTYKVKVTFTHGEIYKVCSVEREFEVTKATLENPTVAWADDGKYDGSIKAIAATAGPLSIGSGMDVEVLQESAVTDPILPGTYTIKLTITDGNYTFAGSTLEYSTTLTIQKGLNSITSLSLDGWIYGETPNTPSATADVGIPTFTYSSSQSGSYVETVPSDAGKYYVKATVAESELYQQAESSPLEFTISKAVLMVRADDKTISLGDPAPTYTYTTEGFKYEDKWATCFTGTPTLSCDYQQNEPQNRYFINVDITGVSPTVKGVNYELATTNGVLSVQGESHTVSFDLNYEGYDDEDVPDPMTAYVNLPYGTLPDVTRFGYLFDGWFVEPSGGTPITPTTLFTANADQKLYAHWTNATFMVTFDYQGGTPGIESRPVTYDMAYGNLPNTSKSGYDFIGWYTESSGGSKITSSTTVTVAADHTLYAHWTLTPTIIVTVSFDSQGGTPAESMTVTVGSPYGTLPDTERDGYVFDGWYTSASRGIHITNGTIVSIGMDHTLYAQWIMYERIVNPDGSVTERYTKEILDDDSSKEIIINETTTWPDKSKVVKDSDTHETTYPDGRVHREVEETVVATDADGSITRTESESVTDIESSGAYKTTENATIENGDNVATKVKVTEVTAAGVSTVTDIVGSEMEEFGIVTSAVSRTDASGTTATAVTVIQTAWNVIDSDIAKAAADNLAFVKDVLGAAEVQDRITIDASIAGTVRISGDAFEQLIDSSDDVTLMYGTGWLTYDADAVKTLSRYGVMDISLSMNDRSALTDAQKKAIGKATFVSVKAVSDEKYIGDLNGTVSITFQFGNEREWKEFAAYYITDDGEKIDMKWEYDTDSKQAVIYSSHHSIYTVLEKVDEPDNTMVWISAGIVAVILIMAAAFLAVRYKKA